MARWPDIPGYRVHGVIGRGGFALVYRAEQLSLGREVALKVLSVLDMSDEEVVRFQRESAALAALDWHHHVARVLDTGVTDEGRPYLAMEYFPRGSVARIRASGVMDLESIVEVGVQIASALDAAHAAGILHRDIKPANILVDKSGMFRLADFGIASVIGTSQSSSAGMAGTVGFLAPEIIRGEKATRSSDVYSLAASLHALVTGVPPFSGPSDEYAAAAMMRTLHEPHVDLRTREVPEWFAAIIDAAMAKDPTSRTATAAEFAAQLQARDVPEALGPLEAIETTRRAPSEAAPAGAVEPVVQSDQETLVDARGAEPATVLRPLATPVTPAQASKPGGQARRGLAAVAAAVVLLGGTGIAIAARGDDETSSPSTTVTATTALTDGSSAPSEPSTVTTAVVETQSASTQPADSSPPATVATTVETTAAVASTVPPAPPATTARPRPTTTDVGSSPPVTRLPATTIPPATAPPATAPPATVATTVATTAPPATTPPAPRLTTQITGVVPIGNGHYRAYNTVNDLCVSVQWWLDDMPGQFIAAPANCWLEYSGNWDTDWFAGSVPPGPGSHTFTVRVTNRAGQTATSSYTFVV